MPPKIIIRFLLVDDLEANLLALEGLLRRDGLELLKARSGPEALELLLSHEVALAFLDVQMPGMNGFELAEAMRSTERTRRVPIIFLTAGAVDQQRRFRGYETGAVDFLFKPIELHILKSKAEVFFELAHQREELRATKHELQQHTVNLEKIVAERTASVRESVAELEAFSYSIAHDLRAPLRSLQGFGKFLVQEYADKIDATGQDYLRRLTTSAARMDRLIQDVLSYSQIVRSEFPLTTVDVEKLLGEIIESYPTFQNLDSKIELEGPIPKVLGNEAFLTQCLANLIGNAIKFVAPGVKPHVRIRAEMSDRHVRIYVQDNGIGIPPGNHEKIFAILQRLSKIYEGTGIGLAIVKKAAERMGGQVGFESEPDRGSTFWIELKRADRKTKQDHAPHSLR